MVRSGLRQLLKIDQAFDLLPIDADIGDGLPHLCQTLSPDVLLIEVATNNSSALRVPADLLASVPHVRILFISTNENAAYVRTVFATGVLGYILKSAAQSELFQAVKQIYRGRRFMILGSKIPSPKISSILLQLRRPGPSSVSADEKLKSYVLLHWALRLGR